jgi:hypothetical protein
MPTPADILITGTRAAQQVLLTRCPRLHFFTPPNSSLLRRILGSK